MFTPNLCFQSTGLRVPNRKETKKFKEWSKIENKLVMLEIT